MEKIKIEKRQNVYGLLLRTCTRLTLPRDGYDEKCLLAVFIATKAALKTILICSLSDSVDRKWNYAGECGKHWKRAFTTMHWK